MGEYTVKWRIELKANSPEEAAWAARLMLLDHGCEAIAFETIHVDDDGDMITETVDLMESGIMSEEDVEKRLQSLRTRYNLSDAEIVERETLKKPAKIPTIDRHEWLILLGRGDLIPK
jgi:hypothetical protein